MAGANVPSVLAARELRVVKTLLWQTISAQLRPAEKDEVKLAIGPSLVEDNEELFAEASALAEILGDVQLNTSELLKRQQLCCNPQRSLLEDHIRALLSRLRHVACDSPFNSTAIKERDPDSIIPKSNCKDKALYEYISTTAPQQGTLPRTPPSRPGTASTRPGTASTVVGTLLSSRPSTASSAGSSSHQFDASSIVQSMADKLNVYEIDAVKEHIWQVLQEEKQALLQDIEYLQALLEDETDLQAKVSAPPPTVEDLKDYQAKLHSMVAQEEDRMHHELRVSSMFAAAQGEPSKGLRIKRMVQALQSCSPACQPAMDQGAEVPGVLGLPSATHPITPVNTLPVPSSHCNQQSSTTLSAMASTSSSTSTSSSRAMSSCSTEQQLLISRPASHGANASSPQPPMWETVNSRAMSAPDPGTPCARLSDMDHGGIHDRHASTSSSSIPSSKTRAVAAGSMQQTHHHGQDAVPSGAKPSRPVSGKAARPSSPARLRTMVQSSSHLAAAGHDVEASVSRLATSLSNSKGLRTSTHAHHNSSSSSILAQQTAGAPTCMNQVNGSPQNLRATDMPAAGRHKIAARLDEEIESVKGGVAAILSKHNYKVPATFTAQQL